MLCFIFFHLNKIVSRFNNMHIFIKVDLAAGSVLHLTVTNNVSSFRVNIALDISFAFVLYFCVIHLR